MDSTANWFVISKEDNELILGNKLFDDQTVTKVRIVPFLGTISDLHRIFYERTSLTTEILQSYKSINFIDEWINDTFICKSDKCKFHDYFFQLMQKSFTVVEICSNCAATMALLPTEIKVLIHSLHFEELDETSIISVNNKLLQIEPPSTFRLSELSGFSELVFIGEESYLCVNIDIDTTDFVGIVKQRISDFNQMHSDRELRVFLDTYDDNSVRYYTENSEGYRNYGTYFVNKVNDITVMSFLLEAGRSSLDCSTLLQFKEVET